MEYIVGFFLVAWLLHAAMRTFDDVSTHARSAGLPLWRSFLRGGLYVFIAFGGFIGWLYVTFLSALSVKAIGAWGIFFSLLYVGVITWFGIRILDSKAKL